MQVHASTFNPRSNPFVLRMCRWQTKWKVHLKSFNSNCLLQASFTANLRNLEHTSVVTSAFKSLVCNLMYSVPIHEKAGCTDTDRIRSTRSHHT